MASAIAHHGGMLELCFACAWDHEARLLSDARLLFTGSGERTHHWIGDLRRGEVVLHNHPSHGVLAPSAEDLAAAAGNNEHGIGTGIISNDVSRLVLLREPHRASGAEA